MLPPPWMVFEVGRRFGFVLMGRGLRAGVPAKVATKVAPTIRGALGSGADASRGPEASYLTGFNAAATLAGTKLVTSPPRWAICLTRVELV